MSIIRMFQRHLPYLNNGLLCSLYKNEVDKLEYIDKWPKTVEENIPSVILS